MVKQIETFEASKKELIDANKFLKDGKLIKIIVERF